MMKCVQVLEEFVYKNFQNLRMICEVWCGVEKFCLGSEF